MSYDFKVPSSDGKSSIYVRSWLPQNGEVKRVIYIAHGMSEHSARYAEAAEYFASKGAAVFAHDHLGHGLTAGSDGKLGYFADIEGWERVVDDIERVRSETVKWYADVPSVLLGHSMGSFLARTYMCRYPGNFSSVILTGTGWNPPLILDAGLLVARAEKKKRGPYYRSDKLNSLCFGAFNRSFRPTRTPFDWLCRDEERVDKYIADNLCGFVFTIKGFEDMLGGMKYLTKRVNLTRMDKNTHVLITSGDHDPVGGMGKGVRKAAASIGRAGVRDVTLHLWKNCRHELFNEPERGEVFAYIQKWLENQVTKK